MTTERKLFEDATYNEDSMTAWDVWQAARALPWSGWQPIDTAPKDELVLVGPTKRMGICVAINDARDGWQTEAPSEWVSIYKPTHWMPLPPPPGVQP